MIGIYCPRKAQQQGSQTPFPSRVARCRRSTWTLVTICLVLASCEPGPGSRAAQDAENGPVTWPTERVTLITHSSPGGGGDILARELGRTLELLHGVTVVVENRVGGSGAVATVYVANRVPKDGSTLQIITPTHLITPIRSPGVPTYSEMTPVANLLLDPTVIYVRRESQFRDLTEMVAYAKQNPGALKWGIGSAGSLDHLVVEEFKEKAQISVTSVPHEGGGDAMVSVLGGHIDAGIGEPAKILPQTRAGNLRILAVFEQERLEEFPDVPAIGEFGYQMVSRKFRGLWGPPGMSAATVTAIADALDAAFYNEPFRTYWQDGGMRRAFIRGSEFGTFLADAHQTIQDFLQRN